MMHELGRRFVRLAEVAPCKLVSAERCDGLKSQIEITKQERIRWSPSSPAAPRGSTVSPLMTKQLAVGNGCPTLPAFFASPASQFLPYESISSAPQSKH